MKILHELELISSYFKMLVEQQKMISEHLLSIDDRLQCGIGRLTLDNRSGISISSAIDDIKCNMVREEELPQYIEKEMKYVEDKTRLEKENPELLDFIQKYCKYGDKYDIIMLADEIKNKYNIPSNQSSEGKH